MIENPKHHNDSPSKASNSSKQLNLKSIPTQNFINQVGKYKKEFIEKQVINTEVKLSQLQSEYSMLKKKIMKGDQEEYLQYLEGRNMQCAQQIREAQIANQRSELKQKMLTKEHIFIKNNKIKADESRAITIMQEIEFLKEQQEQIEKTLQKDEQIYKVEVKQYENIRSDYKQLKKELKDLKSEIQVFKGDETLQSNKKLKFECQMLNSQILRVNQNKEIKNKTFLFDLQQSTKQKSKFERELINTSQQLNDLLLHINYQQNQIQTFEQYIQMQQQQQLLYQLEQENQNLMKNFPLINYKAEPVNNGQQLKIISQISTVEPIDEAPEYSQKQLSRNTLVTSPNEQISNQQTAAFFITNHQQEVQQELLLQEQNTIRTVKDEINQIDQQIQQELRTQQKSINQKSNYAQASKQKSQALLYNTNFIIKLTPLKTPLLKKNYYNSGDLDMLTFGSLNDFEIPEGLLHKRQQSNIDEFDNSPNIKHKKLKNDKQIKHNDADVVENTNEIKVKLLQSIDAPNMKEFIDSLEDEKEEKIETNQDDNSSNGNKDKREEGDQQVEFIEFKLFQQ